MKKVKKLLLFLSLFLPACEKPFPPGTYQGYMEGDYLYISSPLGGTVLRVHPVKGSCINGGTLLFELDPAPEETSYREAKSLLEAAKSRYEDMTKGLRPQELAAMEAAISRAKADLAYAQIELERYEKLFREKAVSEEALDAARSAYKKNKALVEELMFNLKTARMGSREDLLNAAKEAVDQAEAALERAGWRLSKLKGMAPVAACVTDILYDAGEYAPPGYPVIVLLPPEKIKVRFFIPESELSKIRTGQKISVTADGLDHPFPATITYISSSAEYTPPLIYSRESREKLVFLVEAAPDPSMARSLTPGQPVEVSLEQRESPR